MTEPVSNAPGNTEPLPGAIVTSGVLDRADVQIERCRADPSLPDCRDPDPVIRGGFGSYFRYSSGG